MPCVDIHLLRLFGEVKGNGVVDNDVFCAGEGFKISAAVLLDKSDVCPVAEFLLKMLLFGSVVDLPDMGIIVELTRFHQLAEDRIRPAQHSRALVRGIEDHVFIDRCPVVIFGVLGCQRHGRQLFDCFFDTHQGISPKSYISSAKRSETIIIRY